MVRSDSSRGQSMLEFALIAPIFFLLLFGIMEFGVLMFDTATSRFAASEAAKVEAQVGDQNLQCSKVAGCPAIYGNAVGTMCDADCQAIIAIHATALGSTSLEQVNYIEVQKMQASGQPFSPVAVNRFNLNGTAISGYSSYTSGNRNVIAGSTDYLQVNINFTYRWLTGIFNKLLAQPVLDSKFLVRLEPQKFS